MTLLEVDYRSHRMSKRDHQKARAQSRNIQRAAANAIAAVKTLDPAELRRSQIRAAKNVKDHKERRRSIKLLQPHRDPEPDETVTVPLFKAQGQRAAAAALDDKAKIGGRAGLEARSRRKAFLTEAKRFDIEADAARARQLAEHRRVLDLAETRTQAEAQGDALGMDVIEHPSWKKDEHGAIVRDQRGLPILLIETTTTPRRSRHGLEWLRDKERITPEQYRIGTEAKAIWEAAALALEPGRVEIGSPSSPGGKASPGPAGWRLDAIRTEKEMETAIMSFIHGQDGAIVVSTCRSICYGGVTVSKLSEDDRYEAIRIEERLKLGLALIRYWIYAGGAKVEA